MARRLSITFRLTLLFALASTTLLLAAGSIVGFVMEKHFQQMDVSEQLGKLQLIRHAFGKVSTAEELNKLPQQLDDALIGHPGLSVNVIGADKTTWYATKEAYFPDNLFDIATTEPTDQIKHVSWQHNGHKFSGVATSVTTNLHTAPQFTVVIALDIQHREEFMYVFQDTLWILFGFGIVFSAFLGWIAAHQGLAPVRRIALLAKGISATQLNDRLRPESVPSELHDLAESFNGMLSRLEDSFQRLTNFSSDLAHELRAPVSNLMTQTQVALSKTRTADEYRDVLASNLEEFDRLARMTSDMLFLARADHGLMTPQHDRIDLVSEIRQLIEFYEPVSEESGVTMTLQGTGTTTGDRLMIRRALSNLLSNALRHTEPGGEIVASVDTDNTGNVHISIENPGKDIAPNHIAHLFDRFYRVDPARLHSSEGVGLGLAITRSIIEAHRGCISVKSLAGKTRFEITLPAAEGESSSSRAGGTA